MSEPLYKAEIEQIKNLLTEGWEETPARKTAKILRNHGYTSEDFWKFTKTSVGKRISDVWLVNTYNELKNLELMLDSY